MHVLENTNVPVPEACCLQEDVNAIGDAHLYCGPYSRFIHDSTQLGRKIPITATVPTFAY